MSILVLHGPNLNLLGTREPHIYGTDTLQQIDAELAKIAADAGDKLLSLQSNHEGVLIDRIHAARTDCTRFIIISGPQGEQLPPSYSLFGQLTSGDDVVKAIDALGVGDGPPKEPVTITSVTIGES